MKTITLKQAYEILQDCAAVVIDDYTVLLPSVNEPIGEEDHEFLLLSWEAEGNDYEIWCNEGANPTIQVSGSSMFLKTNEGEEIQLTILDAKNIEPN